MGTINKQISRFEVSAVYTHPQAKVDIVLVHGLNGDPQRTWTAKSNGVFWPADLLPASLKGEQANILVYGYNADVYSRRNDSTASDNFIHAHAQTLVTTLNVYRKSEGTSHNPIIWVAHSLGGILVKRALLYSNDVRGKDHETMRSIYVSTYSIIFLGTPHTGVGLATWGHVLQAMSDAVVPKKFFESESVLLKTLKRDNETLQNINNHFLDVYQRFKIMMAHENQKTDFKTSKAFVVDAVSASPQLPGVIYFGIEASHSGMCKFDGPNAPGYRNVTTTIYEWVLDAPSVTRVRWAVEQEQSLARAEQDNYERIRPFMPAQPSAEQGQITDEPNISTPLLEPPPHPPQPAPRGLPENDTAAAPTSPFPLVPVPTRPDLAHQGTSGVSRDPLFIHPEPFRPNSYHVGRENEMRELHKMLMDPSRRKEGTAAVVIQGMPGGGKTHLARQYVFKHRNEYPGGVYWVRSKSVPEMESWYWRIAKTEAIRESLEDVAGQAVEELDKLRDPRGIVDIVRKWFNEFDEWLIVFDGIHFEDKEVERFIPGRANTAIIYTSTNKAVTGDYVFNSPGVVALDLLKAQEAQELLLTEMDKRKPWTTEDRNRATELVNLMGRLPLMIHIAAQQLKATREPLSRYLKMYRKRPSAQAGNLSAYWAVYDQLQHRGATAALNLMSILCFFDQHVPVEMLALGLSALDNRTPVKTSDPSHRKGTLNNTLRILIMFALVERVESDDMSPTSSRSSRQSFDRNVEYLDILKMNSVVQAFFIHVLGDAKKTEAATTQNLDLRLFWLERAAAVFCRSHDEANRRIQEDPNMGLPDDYRRYVIHARKLQDYIERFDRKKTLASMREDLAQRTLGIQQAIDRLSQRVQTHIITRSGDSGEAGQDDDAPVPTTSVFDERTSSQSETDTDSPESRRSLSGLAHTEHYNPQQPWMPGVMDYVPEDSPQYQSPTTYTPTTATASEHPDFHNPYHFHVPFVAPYPDEATMPAAPAIEGDDGDAQTVVPSIPSPRVPPRGFSNGERHTLASPPLSPPWQLVTSANHRTVKRNESRRYHDRAGAWRDRSVSDPRSSVSRETAKVSRFSAGEELSKAQPVPITAESGARMILNKLKQTMSPPAMGSPATTMPVEGAVEEPVASQPLAVRPRLITGAGNNSYANVAAGRAAAAEEDAASSPGEFSNGFLKSMSVSSSPSSWTSITLKKLKENFRPRASRMASVDQNRTPSSTGSKDENVRGSSSSLQSPAVDPVHSEPTASPLVKANKTSNSAVASNANTPPLQPTPLFLGSRSANSSPGQMTSPFHPPPGLPAERYTIMGPGAVQRWESQVYTPGRSRLESSELMDSTERYDHMSRSMPSIRNGEAGRGGEEGQSGAPPRNPPSTQQDPQQRYYQQQQQQEQQQTYRHPSYQINVHPPQAGTGNGPYSRTPPDGYSSLPMSRNASGGAQSSVSGGGGDSSRSIPGAAAGGNGGGGRTTRSSPTGVSPVLGGGRGGSYPAYASAAAHHQYMYGHTPSDTRTEPSPRLGPSFPDVDTSYRKYEERHAAAAAAGDAGHGRRRADSGGLYADSQPARSSPVTRLGRGGSAVSAGYRSRSQSPSPSPSVLFQGPRPFPTHPAVPISFTAPPGSSPDLSAVRQRQHEQQQQQPQPAGRTTTGAAGGEAMSRSRSGSHGSGSGSGGFRVGEGRVIEFGTVPVDVVAAGQRVRRLERERSLRREESRESGGGDGQNVYGLGITE